MAPLSGWISAILCLATADHIALSALSHHKVDVKEQAAKEHARPPSDGKLVWKTMLSCRSLGTPIRRHGEGSHVITEGCPWYDVSPR